MVLLLQRFKLYFKKCLRVLSMDLVLKGQKIFSYISKNPYVLEVRLIPLGSAWNSFYLSSLCLSNLEALLQAGADSGGILQILFEMLRDNE